MIIGSKKAIIDAINENEENLSLKLSTVGDEISDEFGKKMKGLSEKINIILDKLSEDKSALEKEIETVRKSEQTTRSQLGGVTNARKQDAKKHKEEVEKIKNFYIEELEKKDSELDEKKRTILEQNELIQKLTNENNELKNKKPMPTIEELEKDKIFHGKRNDRKRKQCKH